MLINVLFLYTYIANNNFKYGFFLKEGVAFLKAVFIVTLYTAR